MFKKIKNISFLVIFFAFIFLVTKYYFSEQNIVFTNKSRSSYLITLRNGENNLPLGVQLIGDRYDDHRFLGVANWLEKECNN